MELERENELDSQTLIGLQKSLICSGKWLSADKNNWDFMIDHFVEGNVESLRNFSIEFQSIPSWNKFIVIESQGDGRELHSFGWQQNENSKVIISCKVKPKSPRTNPHDKSGDIALNEDFDFLFKDGDLTVVSGMDAALQDIKIHLSSMPGDYLENPIIGTEIPKYFEKYRSDTPLLNRLIKIEIVRLLAVSMPDALTKRAIPSFNYINRVLDVEVLDIDNKQQSAKVRLFLEWGNLETWEGEIKLGINTDRRRIDSEDDEL